MKETILVCLSFLLLQSCVRESECANCSAVTYCITCTKAGGGNSPHQCGSMSYQAVFFDSYTSAGYECLYTDTTIEEKFLCTDYEKNLYEIHGYICE